MLDVIGIGKAVVDVFDICLSPMGQNELTRKAKCVYSSIKINNVSSG